MGGMESEPHRESDAMKEQRRKGRPQSKVADEKLGDSRNGCSPWAPRGSAAHLPLDFRPLAPET